MLKELFLNEKSVIFLEEDAIVGLSDTEIEDKIRDIKIDEKLKKMRELISDLKPINTRQLKTDTLPQNWDIYTGKNFKIYLFSDDCKLSKEEKDVLKLFLFNKSVINPLTITDDEYKIEGIENKASAHAAVCNGVLISFLSKEIWKNPHVNVERNFICDETHVVKTEDKKVRNISKCEHISFHLSKVIEKLTKDEFLKLKDKLSKKIKFSVEIDDQIPKLDSKVFKQFMKVLSELVLGKEISSYKIHPESGGVRTNPYYKSFRKFTILEDRRKRSEYFFNHLLCFPAGYRLHFLEEGDILYIGYIGIHLPTPKFD